MVALKIPLASGLQYWGLYFSTRYQQKFKTIIINDKWSNEKIRILKDKYNNPWSSSKVEDELVLHLSSYAEAEILFDSGTIQPKGFIEYVATNLSPGNYTFYTTTDPTVTGQLSISGK